MATKTELKKRLDEINDALKDCHPKRIRRRERDRREQRDKTRERKVEVLENQEEAVELRERLENQLERFLDDDPLNDPNLEKFEGWQLERIEKYLIAEIDLLGREIERRDPKIKQLRREDSGLSHRIHKLDDKAKRHRERQGKLKVAKRRVLDRIEEIKKDLQNDTTWPLSVQVSELLYHSPPHCHFASPERDKLIVIGRIAAARGIRVGEFPPFDSVECVHTGGSWHYRTAGGGLVLSCTDSRLDLGGDAGCAMDLNDADGGSDKEVAFYHELVERY